MYTLKLAWSHRHHVPCVSRLGAGWMFLAGANQRGSRSDVPTPTMPGTASGRPWFAGSHSPYLGGTRGLESNPPAVGRYRTRDEPMFSSLSSGPGPDGLDEGVVLAIKASFFPWGLDVSPPRRIPRHSDLQVFRSDIVSGPFSIRLRSTSAVSCP